jgi:outer membrane lipoprotein-sorting protein
MRAALTGTLLMALMLGGAGVARAQTADEVVEKTLAAIGGRDALAKLTSRHTTGKMTITSPAGELPGTIEIFNQAPNLVRTLINVDLAAVGAGTMTVDQRFDGTTGAAINSLQGPRDITGDQLANMKNAEFPTPLLHYKERGTKLALAGKEKVNDRDAFALSVTPQAGPASRVFVDAETYLPLRFVVTLELPEVGQVEQTTDLSDYRDVEGIKLPFSIRNSSMVQTVSVTVTKVEHNVKIDSAMFKTGGGH